MFSMRDKSERGGGQAGRQAGQTSEGSLSVVAMPFFVRKHVNIRCYEEVHCNFSVVQLFGCHLDGRPQIKV